MNANIQCKFMKKELCNQVYTRKYIYLTTIFAVKFEKKYLNDLRV